MTTTTTAGQNRLSARCGRTGVAVITSALVLAGLGTSAAQAATAPQVSLTAPAGGSTVSGAVSLSAAASTDPGQSDPPVEVTFVVDDLDTDSYGCGSGPTCNGSGSWDSTGLSGQHTITATLTTEDGLTVTSAPVTVAVYSGTVITLAALKAVRSGTRARVSGRVVSTADGAPAPGQQVTLSLTPVLGRASSVTLTSDASGSVHGILTVAVNSVVRASTPGSASYGASAIAIRQAATAVARCKLRAGSVKAGGKATGYCSVSNLPRKTRVTVQYKYKGHWYTASRGRSSVAKVPLAISLKKRGAYSLRMLFAANRVYAATVSPSLAVRVR